MRDLPSILEDWRALERERAATDDDAFGRAIGDRIEAIRAEHREAVAERSRVAEELTSRPPLVQASSEG